MQVNVRSAGAAYWRQMAYDTLQPGRTSSAPADEHDGFWELDRQLKGRLAKLIGGQSPWAILQAWEDWAFHLAISPGRRFELMLQAMRSAMALAGQTQDAAPECWAFRPSQFDRRFRSPAWRQFPFNWMAQAQIATEELWDAAVRDVRGVASHHQRRVEFLGRFLLNGLAPVNFPLSNPDVLHAAQASGGANFMRGAQLWWEDVARLAAGRPLVGYDKHRVGETLAITPGKVVFRNELFELIQYRPTTKAVRREPVLIVPAWIMKYYILDLTPEESFVRNLVAQGFTVFMMSWRNPGREQANVEFDAYRSDGVMAALDQVLALAGADQAHGVGYCLGGTVLSIAAAAMSQAGDDRLKTLTILAAQTDFAEAGELMMFIDESQLAVLEDMMHVAGFLDARNMAGAFNALRAHELVFSRIVERYLMADPPPAGSIDAWLADPTRMPARMHSEYLRDLFMENRLSEGSYRVDDTVVSLKDIRLPVFALGAERDHIAPWRSVHKIQLYSAAETTFVLSGGGHNTAVVSPPSKTGAYYFSDSPRARRDYVDPDAWLAGAEKKTGSWWPEWVDWLVAHSSTDTIAPPAGGAGYADLADAPGDYVLER